MRCWTSAPARTSSRSTLTGSSRSTAIYAYRLKSVHGDPWRVFTIPSDHDFRGRHSTLYRKMPKLDVSSSGNYIMRWENGMKLSDFLMYTDMSDYTSEYKLE